MDKLFILIMIQVGSVISSPANTTEVPQYDVRETIADMVNELCPLSDICEANSTNAELSPNRVVSLGRVSCCQGCSCHPDCKDKMNCCYPNDYDPVEDAEPATFQSECLYTRLGQPEYLNAFIPAFRTIVAPPSGGCVDDKPIKITSNVILHPTCDDIDVTPFGSYFPVYSKQSDEIYKNILCARCHGVRDTVPFQPLLVCKKSERKSKELTSLTESLGVLETKALSPRCYVDFRYKDLSALKEKRCYKNVIDRCTTHIVSQPLYLRRFNLDFDVIRNLCESGLNAPTVNAIDGEVYRNVFCSLCGKASKGMVLLFCTKLHQEKTIGNSFTFVLDAITMYTIDKASIPKTRSEVCFIQIGTGKFCRRVFCSTGKVRNDKGKYQLMGNFLGSNGVKVQVKLIPKAQMEFDGNDFEADGQRLVEAILKYNFWPKYWTITAILNRRDNTVCDEKAVALIELSTSIENTEMIYRGVAKSFKNFWTLDWGNKTYNLEQSFLEYKVSHTLIGGKAKYLPTWQMHQTDIGPNENVFKCGPMEWNQAYWKFGHDPTIPFFNKLCLCNQIQLRQDEIILGPENTYLESNLTKRALHDNEFDLIEDADGLNAMVCLEDTIFTAHKSNGASTVLGKGVTVLIPAYIISFIWCKKRLMTIH